MTWNILKSSQILATPCSLYRHTVEQCPSHTDTYWHSSLILLKGQFDGQAGFVSIITDLAYNYSWYLWLDMISFKPSWREETPITRSFSCLFFWHVVSKDVEVGKLKVNTKYRVSVGAYGWAGEGRPSMPRDVSTASHGMWVETRSAARLCNFHHSLIVCSLNFPICAFR